MIPAWEAACARSALRLTRKSNTTDPFASRLSDSATIKGIEALIADLLALKEQLHSAQEE
jgi:hypothetical protein